MTNLFWKKYFRQLSASYNVQFEQAHTKGEQFVALSKDMQVFSGFCKNETIYIDKADGYTSAQALFYYKALQIEGTTNKFWYFNYGKNGLLL